MKEINDSGLIIDEYNCGAICGNIDVSDESSNLLLTLPYMAGYRILVDGNKTEYESYRNALVSIPISNGSHVISISFIAPGILAGMVASALFLIVSFALWSIEKIYFMKKKNND